VTDYGNTLQMQENVKNPLYFTLLCALYILEVEKLCTEMKSIQHNFQDKNKSKLRNIKNNITL